jgi:nucleoside-diphosphate-sugar epimerase
MTHRLFTRTNQIVLEGVLVGLTLVLALMIRYDGHIPPYTVYQLSSLLLLVVAGRLVTNALFGLYRIQWRYVGLRDAGHIVAAYFTFSCLLLGLHFMLPMSAGVVRMPFALIVIELLLSAAAGLGVRVLRRYIYERPRFRTNHQDPAGQRRMILVGAGRLGSQVAKQMASEPGITITGFLDDDYKKIGCTIGGIRVLGPTTLLPELVRARRVDDLLVCIAPSARNSLSRLSSLLENLPIRSRFVPTMNEIMDATEGPGVFTPSNGSRGNGNGNGNGNLRHFKPEVEACRSSLPLPPIGNKTILITGGAGFIGSSLATRLVDNNEVILLDRTFTDQPVSFTRLLDHRNVKTVELDIMDGRGLSEWSRAADYVVHAAAIVGVGRVCSYPRETLEVNFVGTSRVLRAFEDSPRLKRLLYFSTSEVFGVNSFRVDENSPSSVGPAAEARWSYAIAKLAGEHLVKAYHRETGLPVVTVRPFNVFGPRRTGAHAILQFVQRCLSGASIEVHGDGSQIRSWCYIEDFCDALTEMLQRPEAIGEDFNVGNPMNTLTMYQLAQKIRDITETSVPINFTEPPFPDIEIRVPALEKAHRVLGYTPKYDLDKALRLTVDWYKDEYLPRFDGRHGRATVIA